LTRENTGVGEKFAFYPLVFSAIRKHALYLNPQNTTPTGTGIINTVVRMDKGNASRLAKLEANMSQQMINA
jgi:hypothetical protein